MEPITEPTLRWTFPYREPVFRAQSFVLRRELPPPASAGQLSLLEKPPQVTFRVDREPGENPGAPGVLHAELSFAAPTESSDDGPIHPEPLAFDEGLGTLAADVWAQCFVISEQGAQHALCQVLGVPPFDALVAARFLAAHVRQYTDELVRLALDDAGKKDELARAHDAPSPLTTALLDALDELRMLLVTEDLFASTLLEDGMPLWCARLTAYLERLGEKELGQQVRERSREQARAPATLWSLWVPGPGRPPLYGLAIAALALWRTKVRPQLLRARTNPPALVMAVHEPVVQLLSRTHRREELNGQKAIVLANEVLVKVSAVDASTLNAIFVDHGFELFGSITAHRLLRWEILTAHKQALEGHPDPRVLIVDGGYSALAHEKLGIKIKRAADELRDIIEAQHTCEIPLPPRGDYSRLLIRRMLAAVGGRRSRLELVLGTALLPNYVHELRAAFGQALERARATRLVPILELPPFVGRPNEHGAQATLSMLVVAHMRDHARDLVDQGGVRIDLPTLSELAQRAAVPHQTAQQVLDRWAHDGEDGPAFLKSVSTDRYTLGDAHAPARAFLEEAGHREQEGSRAGQKSVSKRLGKLRRLGKP